MMSQFQIKPHPHGGTWQCFQLQPGIGTFNPPREYNSVQFALDAILKHLPVCKFFLEVLPAEQERLQTSRVPFSKL